MDYPDRKIESIPPVPYWLPYQPSDAVIQTLPSRYKGRVQAEAVRPPMRLQNETRPYRVAAQPAREQAVQMDAADQAAGTDEPAGGREDAGALVDKAELPMRQWSN